MSKMFHLSILCGLTGLSTYWDFYRNIQKLLNKILVRIKCAIKSCKYYYKLKCTNYSHCKLDLLQMSTVTWIVNFHMHLSSTFQNRIKVTINLRNNWHNFRYRCNIFFREIVHLLTVLSVCLNVTCDMMTSLNQSFLLQCPSCIILQLFTIASRLFVSKKA